MSIIYTLSQDVYHVYAEFEIKKNPTFLLWNVPSILLGWRMQLKRKINLENLPYKGHVCKYPFINRWKIRRNVREILNRNEMKKFTSW